MISMIISNGIQISTDINSILAWIFSVLFVGVIGFMEGYYVSRIFHGNKTKCCIIFALIAMCMSGLAFAFFGSSAMAIFGSILSFILLYASYEDCKTRECDDSIHLMIAIAGLFVCEPENIPLRVISALIILAIMLGTSILTKSHIGGADIKLASAVTFALGLTKGIIGLTVGLIIAVTVNGIRQRKKAKEGFPLIPYLAVGYMMAYFI